MPNLMLRIFRLTRREYFADFFITPPITIAYAVYSIAHGWGSYWLPLFALGAAVWTFYEYALHRWALHGLPFLRDVHFLHHRNQRDYIALHPLGTVLTYAVFWLLFGVHSSALMVGFTVGYIAYAALHTAFHYSGRLAKLFPELKARHVAHHRYHDVWYGVTTSFWDHLFGTSVVTAQAKSSFVQKMAT